MVWRYTVACAAALALAHAVQAESLKAEAADADLAVECTRAEKSGEQPQVYIFPKKKRQPRELIYTSPRPIRDVNISKDGEHIVLTVDLPAATDLIVLRRTAPSQYQPHLSDGKGGLARRAADAVYSFTHGGSPSMGTPFERSEVEARGWSADGKALLVSVMATYINGGFSGDRTSFPVYGMAEFYPGSAYFSRLRRDRSSPSPSATPP